VSEEDKLRFALARPGDHLFCPFQCELCYFRSIQGRSPNLRLGPLEDAELMKSLRRVNLDATAAIMTRHSMDPGIMEDTVQY
jgi:hypothetical protein